MGVWWKHWQTPAPLASSDREDMGAILIIKSYGHSFPYKLSFNLGLFMAALPQFFQRCDIETSHVNSFTNVVKWQQLGSLSEIFKNVWINEGNQWQIKKACEAVWEKSDFRVQTVSILIYKKLVTDTMNIKRKRELAISQTCHKMLFDPTWAILMPPLGGCQ